MKTIRLGREALHIEAPGCIVNVECGLHDSKGRQVTRVDVSANGDRYSGEPEWWCADAGIPLEPSGAGIRVVKGIPKPADRRLTAARGLLEALERLVAELPPVDGLTHPCEQAHRQALRAIAAWKGGLDV